MAWLCSLSFTTLSAIDSIWVWIFFIPSMEVSTDLRPAWATCVAFCALSETDLAFWLETSAVCLTSSTVLVVWVMAVPVSAAPEATCVVAARISLADDASTFTPSANSAVERRRLSIIVTKALPRTSLSDWGLTCTRRSLAAIRFATPAISCNERFIWAKVRDNWPTSSPRS